MAEHIILLTDEDEAALSFLTEQRNLMMPPPPMGSTGPPPMSPDDMLAQLVQMPLQSAKQQVASVVIPLEEMLADVPPEAREAAIGKVKSPAAQMLLRTRLAQR